VSEEQEAPPKPGKPRPAPSSPAVTEN